MFEAVICNMEKKIMDITQYKVKRIIYRHGELQLGQPADVIAEGGFYRIAGTHIIDKSKIEDIGKSGNRMEIRMKDRTVVLVV